MARPPSSLYTLKKWVRRHRIGVSAGAVVAVALLAGLGIAAKARLNEAAEHRKGRQNLYAADVSLAEKAWGEGGPGGFEVVRLVLSLESDSRQRRHDPARPF